MYEYILRNRKYFVVCSIIIKNRKMHIFVFLYLYIYTLQNTQFLAHIGRQQELNN